MKVSNTRRAVGCVIGGSVGMHMHYQRTLSASRRTAASLADLHCASLECTVSLCARFIQVLGQRSSKLEQDDSSQNHPAPWTLYGASLRVGPRGWNASKRPSADGCPLPCFAPWLRSSGGTGWWPQTDSGHAAFGFLRAAKGAAGSQAGGRCALGRAWHAGSDDAAVPGRELHGNATA